ncbi:energy transducer TonB [Lysobacter sp. S4-A87]|uniref:energy transducer TonB n=1 Tax=Lysobacter sp. S4-A87 TaxID=2925843 RepID=UPI001F52E149|nr:energy transducer TonB [Lysobacter sp. S4-A87]UNK49716.1 energy transducer TonB [Lysobacter sp. S4-A87]
MSSLRRHRLAALASVALPLLLAACHKAPDQAAPPAVAPTELMAVDTPPPGYPEELACDNIGGQVLLSLSVGADGKVTAAEVLRGSGIAPLDKAAQEGVRSWTFKAATRGGVAHSSKVQVPVTFRPPAVRPQACFVLDEQRRRAGGK